LSQVVVDASVALAWCFPDESSDYADAVLVSLEGKSILVPSVWGLEIANAILVGERKKRIKPLEIRRFTAFLESLSILQDHRPAVSLLGDVVPLGRVYGLSVYDASYLELALRTGAPLASLDRKLRGAADRAGVKNFDGRM
jgi:predicted nucleic acid-binding protein